MPAKAATPANPGAYFRRTKLHWMLAIGIGMALYTWVVFSPETFPYTYLGSFGTFIQHLVENQNTPLKIGYYGAWLIHVAEAFISFMLFEAKGITDPLTQLKWLVQTVFFGFGSLGLLLAYHPQKTR